MGASAPAYRVPLDTMPIARRHAPSPLALCQPAPCACTRTPTPTRTTCSYPTLCLVCACVLCCPPAEPCPSSQATAAPVRPTTAANTTRRPRDSGRVLVHRCRGQRSRVSHSCCVPRFILQRCHHTHDHHQPSCPWPLLDGVDRTQTLGRGRSTTPPLARSCAPLLADCCAASILTTASIPTTARIVRRGHCNDGTRCKPEQARLRRAGYNTMHAACDRFGALPGGVGVRRVGGLVCWSLSTRTAPC
jgi:hypothetical protein